MFAAAGATLTLAIATPAEAQDWSGWEINNANNTAFLTNKKGDSAEDPMFVIMCNKGNFSFGFGDGRFHGQSIPENKIAVYIDEKIEGSNKEKTHLFYNKEKAFMSMENIYWIVKYDKNTREFLRKMESGYRMAFNINGNFHQTVSLTGFAEKARKISSKC